MAEKGQGNTQAAPPRLPFGNQVLYSLGNVGISIVDRVMATWLMFFYAPPAGTQGMVELVPVKVVGFIFLLGRTLDTFIDPGVAYFSDKCGSRRGRRMPFMLYGGIPLATSLALMFFPPVNHVHILNTVYLAVMLSTFFFFFSFYVCPYLGLLPELTRTPEDRINLTSMQGILMLIGTVIGMVMSPMLIEKFGYGGMAVFMAILAAITFYLPVIGIDEKKYCVAEPSHLSVTETIVSTLKNTPYVIYLIGNLSFWFGFNIITTCVPYYVTALLKLPKEQSTIFFALALGVAFLSIFLINALSRVISKRVLMLMSLLMFLVLLPTIYFFGMEKPLETIRFYAFIDFVNQGVTALGLHAIPKSPVIFGYMIIALIGIPLGSLFIVPNALVADLTDYDEKFTGLRREAIYFGTQGFFQKVNLGISSLLMTQMFNIYGFSIEHPLGIQLTGLVGAFFALTGVIAFLIFPKDLNKHAEMMLAKKGARK